MSQSFSALDAHYAETRKRVKCYPHNMSLQNAAHTFLQQAADEQFHCNFFWCGVPIVQIGQDIQALQEIIWQVKPDCIIETGVAWGGSLMFSASMLCILEACSLIENGSVIGIDIEIRPHNRKNIEAHPLSKKITLVEGSSIAETTLQKVRQLIVGKQRIMVMLDSNHTHEHVLDELRLYTPFISLGSYCIVSDTAIEDFETAHHAPRPWGKGNNPKTAVHEFLRTNDCFEMDKYIEDKLLITASPDGFLKRVK